jgi:hypothetical protein
LPAPFGPSQYLNWDVAADRAILRRQSWNPCASLLAMDEIRNFTDLIREEVVEFSRLREINTMRLFVELLRERVGSRERSGAAHPASTDGFLRRRR